MLLYPCSHKTYRQIIPCEKPIRHWTGLWRTKEVCKRRVPSVVDGLCPKCTMDRLTRLPYDANDPDNELRQALYRQPKYVGVEPRPRETSTSPSPSRGPGFLGLTHIAGNIERRKKEEANQLTFFQEAKEPADFDGVDFPGPWWDWDKKPIQESQQPLKAYYTPSSAAPSSSRHCQRRRATRPETGFVARPHPTRVPPWGPGISSQPTTPSSRLLDNSRQHPTRPDSPIARSVLQPGMEKIPEDVTASDSGYAYYLDGPGRDDSRAWFDSLHSYKTRGQPRNQQPDNRQYHCTHNYPYSSR